MSIAGARRNRRRIDYRLPLALLAAASLLATQAFAADVAVAPRREFLASGDAVPPFGHVGRFGATLRGIDPSGRLLVAADLSDGTSALYWAAENGLTALPIETPEASLYPETSVSSSGGRVALRGVRPGESGNPPASVFVLDADGPRRVVSVGDRTAEGLYVHWLNELTAVSDDGTAIVQALVSTQPPPQSLSDVGNAVLAANADGIHAVAGNVHPIPAERRFDNVSAVGTSANGDVALVAWSNEQSGAVYVADADGIHRRVGPGDRLPSGGRIREVGLWAISPDGELLVRACAATASQDVHARDCAIYRTQAGTLVRVIGAQGRLVDGFVFDTRSGRLSPDGAVVLEASWQPPCHDDSPGCVTDYGLLLVSPTGRVSRISGNVSGGWIAAAGEIGIDAPTSIDRWADGERTTIIDANDTAPNGARFASHWMDYDSIVCAAPDGRVGALVRLTDGSQALVCGDADGVHPIIHESDQRFLAGYGFWPSAQCAFADGDEMYFGVRHVWRATTAGGIEPVIGGDDPRDPWVGEPDTDQLFSVNRHGTVAGIDGDQILVRRRGGELESIDLDTIAPWPIADIFELEIADDDSLLATVKTWDDRGGAIGPASRLIRITASGVELIARRGGARRHDPAVLDGSPEQLHVAGGLAAFADERDYYPWPFLYDLGSGQLQAMLAGPELPASAYLIDVAADGTALVDAEHYGWGRFVFDGTGLRRISEGDQFSDHQAEPLALPGPGVVLFNERSRGRGSLTLSGGSTTGRCPRIEAEAPPVATPTAIPAAGDSGGCRIGPPADTGWWLVLGGVALARQRRRRSPARDRGAVTRGA